MIRAKLPPQIEWQEIRRAKRRPASAFCGMTYLLGTYRHGEKRKVGLPPLKSEASASKRPLRGEKRRHVLDEVIKILRHWSSSPFEREGSTLAGLRSGLVLKGNRWAIADFEAAEIVAEGLRIIGARRPEWIEGQPEWSDQLDFCAWCGKPMPDELVEHGRRQRFCSPVCAKSAIQKRNAGILAHEDIIKNDARRVITREKLPPTTCVWCGTLFRPLNPDKHGTQQFCSHRCRGAAMVTTDPVTCLNCGTVFQPKNSGDGRFSKFCSTACSNAYGKSTRYEKTCECCGQPFVAKRPDTVYCGRRCSRFIADWRNEIRIPSKLSDLLFDYLFTAPAALARAKGVTLVLGAPADVERPERMFLTVGIFDRLCAAA
ncbi:hypothetical protein KL86PLE_130530 [uncultured Pleomorphomonas sp.]|uniref:TRASH domain-containing protein n=1 Tax=uncultured Pleomorphomonas sp. TaxID=442121 RepID=A0A212KXL4_9HYPH|nr:hypothetical protein [uncultured Pleomorphomonas sp.]SCM70013.1 hypothetical protein KL86PLE_10005 [uncultured Pleomorphomonas sp.]SCM75129.1 hypothetical protein KL86PLE_130530 [uncultured Pleomorphomonas sp.]